MDGVYAGNAGAIAGPVVTRFPITLPNAFVPAGAVDPVCAVYFLVY